VPGNKKLLLNGGGTLAPVIINIVAAQSSTGKTTLIERILPLLKSRGYRVAAIKGNLKRFSVDPEGKDSFRLGEAGADIAGLAASDRFILTGKSVDKSGTEAAIELLRDFDLILIEGDKHSENPKIEVLRSAVNRSPLLPANTVAVVSDLSDLMLPVPVLPLEKPGELADFIERTFFPLNAEKESPPSGLTHFDPEGRPRMVDVSAKEATLREAYARGEILMKQETLEKVTGGRMAKGDVLAVAQVAAVMAVKETGRLIPMAHPLGISAVEVDFEHRAGVPAVIEIGVRVKLSGQTGVEMEALTGVSVAALTVYDMCKAVDKDMVIQNIRLVEKKGGCSGHYRREQQ